MPNRTAGRQEELLWLRMQPMPPRSRRVDTPSAVARSLVSRARIVALEDDGSVFVRVGRERTRRAAVASHVDLGAVTAALASGIAALVVFEEARVPSPVIIGFVGETAVSVTARTIAPVAGPCIEADVDGRRVRVVAKDEIVLECGKASITMRRNGKVIVRGTHVETNSAGTNRIKGGQVRIN